MGAQAIRLSNVDIDNALKNKDFELLFQPIFDLGNGALARVETFVRWRHPSLGVLPPGAFISFFETQGRMSELTRYVLAEALQDYQQWRGPYPPGFSINLALSDLADEGFASHLTVILREAGFPPECVTLECPMPTVSVDLAQASKQFQRLADTGARLAIEVRGRANDFLRSIDPFPFAEIKTGGAAILRFARTVRGPGLSAISELLELANAQNAAITAVGVEDQASLSALRGLGFVAAQGNHLGKVGALSQFSSSQVNDVRALLGLEQLTKDDLAALFRTGGPELPPSGPQEAPPQKTQARQPRLIPEAAETPKTDDLVERLAARLERADETVPKVSLRAEKEKALKAAAIARARARLAQRAKRPAKVEAVDAPDQEPVSSPPRDMHNRLTQEFEAFADDDIADAEDIRAAQSRTEQTPADANLTEENPTADANQQPIATATPEPTPSVDEFELSDDDAPQAAALQSEEATMAPDNDPKAGDDAESAPAPEAHTDEPDQAVAAAVHTEPEPPEPAMPEPHPEQRQDAQAASETPVEAEAAVAPAVEAPAPAPSAEIAPTLETQTSETRASETRASETQAVEARASQTATGGTHVSISNASAHFVPAIRISQPGIAPLPARAAEQTMAPPVDEQEVSAPSPSPAQADDDIVMGSLSLDGDEDADENADPSSAMEVRESAWIEESLALEQEATPRRARRKNFLTRTVIPYSALQPPKHFLPRALRRRLKSRKTQNQPA